MLAGLTANVPCRQRAVVTRAGASLNIAVPDAAAAVAGRRLLVHVRASSDVPPRSLNLTIKRTLRLRLGGGARDALTSPLLRAARRSMRRNATAADDSEVALTATIQRFSGAFQL